MKISFPIKAVANTGSDGLNFAAAYTKAKAAVQAATRDRDNAQAALDVAQARLAALVEQRLQSYAL